MSNSDEIHIPLRSEISLHPQRFTEAMERETSPQLSPGRPANGLASKSTRLVSDPSFKWDLQSKKLEGPNLLNFRKPLLLAPLCIEGMSINSGNTTPTTQSEPAAQKFEPSPNSAKGNKITEEVLTLDEDISLRELSSAKLLDMSADKDTKYQDSDVSLKAQHDIQEWEDSMNMQAELDMVDMEIGKEDIKVDVGDEPLSILKPLPNLKSPTRMPKTAVKKVEVKEESPEQAVETNAEPDEGKKAAWWQVLWNCGDRLPMLRLNSTQRRLVISLLVILGIFVALFVLIRGSESAKRGRQNDLERQCQEEAKGLGNLFVANVNQVEVYRGLLETFYTIPSTPRMNQSDFASYTNATSSTRPLVEAIVFAVKVPDARREAFEASAGGPILSLNGLSVRSQAPYYAPALFCSPSVAYRVIRRDLLQDPVQAAVADKAMLSGRWALTSPYYIFNINRLGLGYSSPLYRKGFQLEGASSLDKRDALIGWLGASFDFQAIVAQFSLQSQGTSTNQSAAMEVWVYDVTNGSTPITLYQPPRYEIRNASQLAVSRKLGTVGFPLDFSDPFRQFEMRCGYIEEGSSFLWRDWPWFVVILAIDCLLVVVIHGIFRRMRLVEKDYERMERLKDDMKEAKIAAESADVAKSQFLATVSHEIRTPINGVMGMLSLLADTPLNSTQEDYVTTARSSGQTLVNLINDVLDFSKIEAGRMDMESRPFDLRLEVDTVLSMFADKVQLKGIELGVITQPIVPQILIGDPARLRQVLINLVGNAVKFTARGHILVSIRVAEEGEDLRATHAPSPSPIWSKFNSFLYVKEEEKEGKKKTQEKSNRSSSGGGAAAWKLNMVDSEELIRKVKTRRLSFFYRKKGSRVGRDGEEDEEEEDEGYEGEGDDAAAAAAADKDSVNFVRSITESALTVKNWRSSKSTQFAGRVSKGGQNGGGGGGGGGAEGEVGVRSGGSAPGKKTKGEKASSAGPSSPQRHCLDWDSNLALVHQKPSRVFDTLSGWEAANEAHSSRVIGEWMQRSPRASVVHQPGLGEPRSNVRLIVSVEDTGCGIKKDMQAQIFQPFMQVDSSSVRLQGGTGIGLSISHKLVELMGGSMGFVSKFGCGSTFFFDFILQLAAPDSPTSRRATRSVALLSAPPPAGTAAQPSSSSTSPLNPHSLPFESARLAGQRVLLVDDCLVRGQVAASHLLSLGIACDQAVLVRESPDDPSSVSVCQPMAVFQEGGGSGSTAVGPGFPAAACGPHHSRNDSQSSNGLQHGSGYPGGDSGGTTPTLGGADSVATHSTSHSPTASIWSAGWATPVTNNSTSNSPRTSEEIHLYPPHLTLPPDAFLHQYRHSHSRSHSGGGGGGGGGGAPFPHSSSYCCSSGGLSEAPQYLAVLVDGDARLWGSKGMEAMDVLKACPALGHLFASPSASASSASHSASPGPPLVLTLRSPDARLDARARRRGFRAVLHKPIRRGQLAEALVEAAGLRAAAAAAANGRGEQGTASRASRSAPRGRGAGGGGGGRQVDPQLVRLLQGRRFLVVDDNMVNRKVASKMLAKYSVASECVDGGAKAVDKLRADHAFHMVLMDIQMPEMDGCEASVRIRENERADHAKDPSVPLRRVPIIALTADVLQGVRERCTESGMDGFLSKPIDEDLFNQTCLQFFQDPVMSE